MKAWLVSGRDIDDGYAVVFAENRNAARSAALGTDACEDSTYTDIKAVRLQALDRFYKGRTVMDWEDSEERALMARYAGLCCSYDTDIELEKCRNCSAHKWCGRYEMEAEDE